MAFRQTRRRARMCSSSNAQTSSKLLRLNDLELAVGRPRPPQHPLRLGDGRRDLPHRADHAPARSARPACSSCRCRRNSAGARREISSALSIRFILFGLMAPFAAALLNRYGLRNVTLTALLIVVSGLVASLAMTQGLAADAAVGRRDRHRHRHDRAGARRHHRRRAGSPRGAASWSASSPRASATGQLVFLPLLASLTERYRLADRAGARLRACSASPRLPVLAADARPAERSSACARSATRAPSRCRRRRRAPRRSWPRRSARCATPRSRRVFWILFATFFICGASTNGLIQVHLIPMCLDFGIPQVQAAGLLAAMGIFDFVGTIVSGWLSDRYDNRWLLFWYYGLRGLSLLFLPFTDFSFYGLSLFAMFYGLDWIATVPPTVRLTAQTLRRRARQPRVRLDLCRPSARRGDRGLRRRACRARCLRATCRPSSSPARSCIFAAADRAGDLAAGAEAGGGSRSGVMPLVSTTLCSRPVS